MRRSTAAAVGTLTGAALILGVRLSVQPPAAPAAEAAPVADQQTTEPAAGKKPASSAPSKKKDEKPADKAADKPAASGLKDGTYKGRAVQNQYGTVQVTIKVTGGKVTDATATYPKNGYSGTINPNAVTKLGQETLKAQSAKVDTVSGATFTSGSYKTSLQAALDAAA
ncbi:peptidase [Actinoplanes sp. SE50]|uniref:FMN-binding protein n=1 Tax=unclassified Actinoplanes TaxID=2626549 RepID=UPI00023ED500|nr:MULTISPECIES: FMN-binding protein [unclassified Actinoplanes]AEV87871.1 Zinc metalloprotease zmpB [Actinoplanes sp. SE50/110]ATO86275.1 peptidase [Actinoplanes sp. SE50]SLM03690.1 peptidase [Actinoplanes sp. SE50/110]